MSEGGGEELAAADPFDDPFSYPLSVEPSLVVVDENADSADPFAELRAPAPATVFGGHFNEAGAGAEAAVTTKKRADSHTHGDNERHDALANVGAMQNMFSDLDVLEGEESIESSYDLVELETTNDNHNHNNNNSNNNTDTNYHHNVNNNNSGGDGDVNDNNNNDGNMDRISPAQSVDLESVTGYDEEDTNDNDNDDDHHDEQPLVSVFLSAEEPTINIAITGTQFAWSNSNMDNPVTLFKVEASMSFGGLPIKKRVCLHRYSSFYRMNVEMREEYARYHTHIVSNLPTLPPRRFLVDHTSEEFILQRKFLLAQYLRKLVHIPYIQKSAALLMFLKLDT